MNKAGKGDGDFTEREHSKTLAEEMIKSFQTDKLVYCRFGKKYMENLEKQANSKFASANDAISRKL